MDMDTLIRASEALGPGFTASYPTELSPIPRADGEDALNSLSQTSSNRRYPTSAPDWSLGGNVGKEQTMAAWDPTGIFEQWNGPFGQSEAPWTALPSIDVLDHQATDATFTAYAQPIEDDYMVEPRLEQNQLTSRQQQISQANRPTPLSRTHQGKQSIL